jgi:metal-responsive CopG/Arc/MetJ family transcriptional regulator
MSRKEHMTVRVDPEVAGYYDRLDDRSEHVRRALRNYMVIRESPNDRQGYQEENHG